MIRFKQTGDFSKTERYLKKVKKQSFFDLLDSYAKEGVDALASSTPKDTGLTASSWSYEISKTKSSVRIIWKNSNIIDGTPIAIILQYGHGTGNGGFIAGQDYINPAIKPIFDDISEFVRKEMSDS